MDNGAVEIGVQSFHHPGTAMWARRSSFQLWQYKDGAWKISRVISYDHGGVK